MIYLVDQDYKDVLIIGRNVYVFSQMSKLARWSLICLLSFITISFVIFQISIIWLVMYGFLALISSLIRIKVLNRRYSWNTNLYSYLTILMVTLSSMEYESNKLFLEWKLKMVCNHIINTTTYEELCEILLHTKLGKAGNHHVGYFILPKEIHKYMYDYMLEKVSPEYKLKILLGDNNV